MSGSRCLGLYMTQGIQSYPRQHLTRPHPSRYSLRVVFIVSNLSFNRHLSFGRRIRTVGFAVPSDNAPGNWEVLCTTDTLKPRRTSPPLPSKTLYRDICRPHVARQYSPHSSGTTEPTSQQVAECRSRSWSSINQHRSDRMEAMMSRARTREARPSHSARRNRAKDGFSRVTLWSPKAIRPRLTLAGLLYYESGKKWMVGVAVQGLFTGKNAWEHTGPYHRLKRDIVSEFPLAGRSTAYLEALLTSSHGNEFIQEMGCLSLARDTLRVFRIPKITSPCYPLHTRQYKPLRTRLLRGHQWNTVVRLTSSQDSTQYQPLLNGSGSHLHIQERLCLLS